ncbi:MAG TPA: IclR family transcriptional regulator C-terminal domain-containing protein [Alphaproteobacteria bacterium]|nr:IclR family transcriptional regulator C-terminal domain-containing protein [Alphaproteobacteria bacterium]
MNRLATAVSESSRRDEGEFVEAIARGLRVIEAFDGEHSEMTLSEVAAVTRLPPATARRCLHTLEALGYVRRVGRRFVLSARVLSLGTAYTRAAQIEEMIVPEIRALVETFGDAASVGVLDGGDILYVAHISRQKAVRMTAAVGVRYPAYANSMGRVLLAFLDDAARDAYFASAQLRKLTDATVTSRRELERIFAEVRRVDYVTVVDQLDYGITALAIPIRGPTGSVVAALNTSGYTGRITPRRLIDERLATLREAGARIERKLVQYPALADSALAPRPSR